MGVRVQVFASLIIKTANSPTGSAGICQWMDDLAIKTKTVAVATAPRGKPSDRIIPPGRVKNATAHTAGEYSRSFGMVRIGTNGHKQRRRVYNSAQHANIVEKGRSSTKGGAWEYYSSNGGFFMTHGTKGRPGKHILERAFEEGLRTVRPSRALDASLGNMGV